MLRPWSLAQPGSGMRRMTLFVLGSMTAMSLRVCTSARMCPEPASWQSGARDSGPGGSGESERRTQGDTDGVKPRFRTASVREEGLVTGRSVSTARQEPGTDWVLLAFRLPREPATPRIALWRKLRRLGAVLLLDGLVALPLDSRNREHFEWLADEVVDAGGEASIWIGRLASAAHGRQLGQRMRAAVAADYQGVIDDAAASRSQLVGQRRRSLARLRRELRRIRLRDYFPPPEREDAHRAVEELAALVEEPVPWGGRRTATSLPRRSWSCAPRSSRGARSIRSG